MLPEAEREQVLVGFNQKSAEYPRETCIHTLFEQQVERTPNATAVIFRDATITYAELNTRANQLAHYLRYRRTSDLIVVRHQVAVDAPGDLRR